MTPYLAAALAGASSLVYQVLWLRRFSEVFGHGAQAIAVVLSAFLLGFGVGAAVCGRMLDSGWQPRRVFVVLQLALVAYAVLFPTLTAGLEALYLAVLPAEPTPGLALAVRCCVAGVGLLLPSVAFGATVPALAACVVVRSRDVGTVVGRLYGADTLGAAAGAWLTTFVLLPEGGVALALSAAAVANAAAAALAWQQPDRASVGDQPDSGELRDGPPRATDGGTAIAFAAFASGFASLGLEALWIRALAARLSSTVFSFALVLTTFLTALAIGSFVAASLDRRGLVTRRGVAVALVVAGLAGLVSIRLLALVGAESGRMDSLGALHGRELGSALLVMLVPCLGLGSAFPMVAKLAHREMTSLGTDLGRIYLSNTSGAIIAPLVAGFVLLPIVGLSVAIALVSCLPLVAALVLLLGSRPAGLRPAMFVTALGVFGLVLLPVDLRRWQHAPGDELLDYREGTSASVAVVRSEDGDVSLYLDYAYRLGTQGAHFPQRRQGVLPLLLHGSPQRVLFLGAGTGTSAGAASALGDVHVDVTEIVPEVIAMLPHFRAANFGLAERAQRDPGIRVLPVDARHYVRTTHHRYDVVIADLFMPWLAGEAKMYTVEHFSALRSVLTEGGLVCQWLPLFQMSEETLAAVVATFGTAFPHMTAWWAHLNVQTPILGLVGSKQPIRVSPDRFFAAVESAERRQVLAAVALTSAREVAAHWLMGRASLLRLCSRAPLETRARPRLEFVAPRALLVGREAQARASVMALLQTATNDQERPFATFNRGVRGRVLAGSRVMRGRVAMTYHGERATAIREFSSAVAAAGDWNLAARDLELALQDALAANALAQVEQGARALRDRPSGRAIGHYYLAVAALRRGDRERARDQARAAQRLRPNDAKVRTLIAEINR